MPHQTSSVVLLERDSANSILVPLERDTDRSGAWANKKEKKYEKCVEDAEDHERKIQNLTTRCCTNILGIENVPL